MIIEEAQIRAFVVGEALSQAEATILSRQLVENENDFRSEFAEKFGGMIAHGQVPAQFSMAVAFAVMDTQRLFGSDEARILLEELTAMIAMYANTHTC